LQAFAQALPAKYRSNRVWQSAQRCGWHTNSAQRCGTQADVAHRQMWHTGSAQMWLTGSAQMWLTGSAQDTAGTRIIDSLIPRKKAPSRRATSIAHPNPISLCWAVMSDKACHVKAMPGCHMSERAGRAVLGPRACWCCWGYIIAFPLPHESHSSNQHFVSSCLNAWPAPPLQSTHSQFRDFSPTRLQSKAFTLIVLSTNLQFRAFRLELKATLQHTGRACSLDHDPWPSNLGSILCQKPSACMQGLLFGGRSLRDGIDTTARKCI